jgi:hypothetical protein
MIIVLIAHSEIATVNDPRVASYTSYQLRLHKRARALVEDSADLIGFLATDVIIKSEQGGLVRRAHAPMAARRAGCIVRGGRHLSPKIDTACLSVSGSRKPSISCPRWASSSRSRRRA